MSENNSTQRFPEALQYPLFGPIRIIFGKRSHSDEFRCHSFKWLILEQKFFNIRNILKNYVSQQ